MSFSEAKSAILQLSDLQVYHEVLVEMPLAFERRSGKGLKFKKELAALLLRKYPHANQYRLLPSLISLAGKAEKELEGIEQVKKFLSFKQGV